MMITAATKGTKKLTISHAIVALQYANPETPLMLCRCFALISRSRTMKIAYDAGMNTNEMTVMTAAETPDAAVVTTQCSNKGLS